MRIILRPGAQNAFGPVLKRLREQSRRKMTQDDLAARLTNLGLPMDRTIISRIENQRRTLSDIELLYFAKALRSSLVRIIELADRPRVDLALFGYPDDPPDELDIRVAEPDPDSDLP